MGIFIQIEMDGSRMTPDVAERIVPLCPVDIFALDRGHLTVRPEQEDECTLCELCLDTAPAGALTIRKTYKDEQLVSRGTVPSAVLSQSKGSLEEEVDVE